MYSGARVQLEGCDIIYMKKTHRVGLDECRATALVVWGTGGVFDGDLLI